VEWLYQTIGIDRLRSSEFTAPKKRLPRPRLSLTLIFTQSVPSGPSLTILRFPRMVYSLSSAVAVLFLVGVGALAASGAFQSTSRRTIPPKPIPIRSSNPKSLVITNQSCSASACHGAADSANGRMWTCSATLWQTADPHSGTFSLLTQKPNRPVKVYAETMIRRLGWKTPATEEARCLACHSDPTSSSARAEGVGCQTCHGPADKWLLSHTTGNNIGMVALNDVAARAQNCAGCHIGAAKDGFPRREVDHDLIAAGHPRLTYDFAEHHRRLPKHWEEKVRTSAGVRPVSPNFELRLWLVGLAVEAQAASQLLASRAASSAWPELAEFRCSSCHHTIPDDNRTPSTGSLRWRSSWSILTSGGRNPALKRLFEIMGERRPPSSNRIGEAAEAASVELNLTINALSQAPDSELRKELFDRLGPFPLTGVDGEDAVPLLQALAADERGRRRNRPEAVTRVGDRDFEDAYDCARQQNWGQLKDRLGIILRKLQELE